MKYYIWQFDSLIANHKGRFAVFEVTQRKRWGGTPTECRSCHAKIGNRDWLGPYIATIDKRAIGDLCTDAIHILLSPKAQEAIADERLTGLKYTNTPIEIVNYPEIRDYRVCRFTSVEQTLNAEQSGLEMISPVNCDRCMLGRRKKLDRIVFAEPLPTLDVFLPSCLYGYTVVSERFVNTVKQYKLTNFRFISQDDFSEPRIYRYE